MLKEMYIDMHRMEGIVGSSGLRQLFIRPVRLVPGGPTGTYRTATEADDYSSGGMGMGY